ncbi:MAG: hypothetical protein AAGE52_20445 [Myxococcota bacterium]
MKTTAEVTREWFAQVWDPDATESQLQERVSTLFNAEPTGVAGRTLTRDQIMPVVLMWRKLLPGLRMSVDTLLTEGEIAMAAVTWRWGEHTFPCAVRCRVQGGKIVEADNFFDTLVLNEILGWSCATPTDFWAQAAAFVAE